MTASRGTPIRRIASLFAAAIPILLVAGARPVLAQVWGDPVDVSEEFRKLEQVYFVGSRLAEFDPGSGRGRLQWDRYRLQPALSFNKVDLAFSRAESDEFPGTEYARDPVLPFAITFVSPRTVRLRFSTRDVPIEELPSLMLAGPVPASDAWVAEETDEAVVYTGPFGRVRIQRDPWHVEIRDAGGRLATRTMNVGEPATFSTPVPFSFVRRARDMGRSTAAAFELQHDEKLFGAGESFTRFDKRGQKLNLSTRDGMGAQTGLMYKPVPFYLSSNGYGMFVHTSAPVTIDFGQAFDQSNVVYSGDEMLDLFVFLGEPKDILSEYTALTGRSPMPPLWSFGLWMSRITYQSETEVRDVAAKLRQHRVPADVIHLDTGWFETDWQSNYEFSTTRFDDPAAMIADLRAMGFRVSLWQLPYYTDRNSVFREVVGGGFHVKNAGGRLPEFDATLDFSNPGAVAWYRAKLKGLLDLGVGVIKADFGEGAPLDGLYASGRTGWYEHNLYPLRYNQVVYDVTKEVTGDGIIWGRSAWAGSQRYPLHWGGDAENTNSAMAATLRAGLSMGLSGFTFWSHDVGGFVQRAPRDLYSRWLPFGALSSHMRTHGAPPREPWEYDPEMVEEFRRALGVRYTLMPYILAQARQASSLGHPMMRALFFDYPDDPTSWLVEDEYLFGTDLLVAPLFSEARTRDVYLPPGAWIDYQTGRVYEGGRWHPIEAGAIPVVLLVRDHAVLPHLALAQNTADLDWNSVELRVFSTDGRAATGLFSLPGGDVHELSVEPGADGPSGDPLAGSVSWRVTRGGPR
jgi:alpha-D-xyloside xylohydrolase